MKEILAVGSALVFASCAVARAPWKDEGLSGSRMLPGVSVIRGGHCESSAITNALRYEGYDVSESMVTGGGGALSFMFMKGTFPFVGARNEDMKERFFAAARIPFHDEIPSGPDSGWRTVDGLLGRNIPVVLRVDMRFLPYRYGGKYGPAYSSFGAHYITLFGADYEKGIALVSDTEYDGLQSVKLADLQKARTSATKNFPPRAEFYWAEPAPDSGRNADGKYSLDADALVRSSFAAVSSNYEGGALAGLERYGSDIASLETYSRQKFLLPAVLEYMAGNIEDFGTGGASFRMLYRDFLAYASVNASAALASKAQALVPYADDSIALWHELSRELRASSKRIKGMSEAKRRAELARIGKIADGLYIREKAFYTELKKLQ